MPDKLDRAFAEYNSHEHLLSLSPRVIADVALGQQIYLDYGKTVSFIEQHGIPQYYFYSPLIEICDIADMSHNPDGSYTEAFINIAPVSHEEKVYFPHIRLSIDPENPSENALNMAFRHELAHFIHQDTSPPLYNRKGFGNIVKSIGMGALSYSALSIGFSPSPANILATTACAAIGSTLTEMPFYFGHSVFPRELRANYFAWRHKDFKPLRISKMRTIP